MKNFTLIEIRKKLKEVFNYTYTIQRNTIHNLEIILPRKQQKQKEGVLKHIYAQFSTNIIKAVIRPKKKKKSISKY